MLRSITPKSSSVRLQDLLSELNSGAIRVNEEYQRSGRIWPARAKSFLVETVLLKMPIPRVLLHVVDQPQPPHHSDIIDGQQRCSVLREFYNNGFELTADIDDANNHGKRFKDLTASQKSTFKDYAVPIDRYEGITDGQIRHVFRRLNYYTAPLNAAEQRHAQFSGALAQFVEQQSRAWAGTFQRLRAFTKKQLRRKADQQLMAEIVDAMQRGISTPTAKTLRNLYKLFDRQFPSTLNFGQRLEKARDQIDQWAALRKNRLMRKHYQLFAFIMSLMHSQSELASLRKDVGARSALSPENRIMPALQKLQETVRNKSTKGAYAAFWHASGEKTNTRDNRLTRCRYYFRALTGSRKRV